MGTNSKIEWCDHTFNPWEGCTKVSPGCAHCYAAARDERFHKGIHWGPGAPRRRTSAAAWRQPLTWDRKAADKGNLAPRVCCASLADWLDWEVPCAWRVDLLNLIEATPHIEWLLLTKRPQSWDARLNEAMAAGSKLAYRWVTGSPPTNVRVGVSVEDQPRANERRDVFKAIPAQFSFVSYEPALRPVEWSGWEFIDQLICGGESGPCARPMHPAWAREALAWCERSDVSFFFKQWGEWLPAHQMTKDRGQRTGGSLARAVHTFPDGLSTYRVGKLCAGRMLDGVTWDQIPVPF